MNIGACVYEERSGYCWCSVQPCLTLCDPMDCSPPGSSLHGIHHARILEWVAMPSSRGSSQIWDRTHVSCVSCFGRQVLYHGATREALSSGRIPFWFSDKSYIQTFSATASLSQTTGKMAAQCVDLKQSHSCQTDSVVLEATWRRGNKISLLAKQFPRLRVCNLHLSHMRGKSAEDETARRPE